MNKVNLKEFLSGDGAQYFQTQSFTPFTTYTPKPDYEMFMRTNHVFRGRGINKRIEGRVERIDLMSNNVYYATLKSKGVVDHVPLEEEVELTVSQTIKVF